MTGNPGSESRLAEGKGQAQGKPKKRKRGAGRLHEEGKVT